MFVLRCVTLWSLSFHRNLVRSFTLYLNVKLKRKDKHQKTFSNFIYIKVLYILNDLVYNKCLLFKHTFSYAILDLKNIQTEPKRSEQYSCNLKHNKSAFSKYEHFLRHMCFGMFLCCYIRIVRFLYQQIYPWMKSYNILIQFKILL